MAYFKYFTNISYSLSTKEETNKVQSITNVLARARKKLEITNTSIFEQYFIKDSDRADSLAYRFYGDSTLHWIILYANYMTNPYYDWPLTYFDLQRYVAKKYDNINGIHHYEDSDGNEVDAPNTIISPSGRTSGPADAITNFVYEERLNDKKRVINVIRVEYIEQIINEFKNILQ